MPLFLSNDKAILFLHVPKCGGTSVVEIFLANGYSAQLQMTGLPVQSSLTTSPQHQTCAALKSLINFGNLSDVFILARSPYQRIVSEFNWAFRGTKPRNRPNFSKWVVESLSLAAQDPLYSDSHFRPAIDFLDERIPAKVFRLEDGLGLIAECFLSRPQKSASITIAHRNNSGSMPYSEHNIQFSPEALSAVNEFYYYDFVALGYRMYGIANSLSEGGQERLISSDSLLAKARVVSTWRLSTWFHLEEKIRTSLKLRINAALRGAEERPSPEYDFTRKKLNGLLWNLPGTRPA